MHSPNLETVRMIEDILKQGGTIKRAELKRRLPRKVMHQTMNVALEYLEERGLIEDSRKGITWRKGRGTVSPSISFSPIHISMNKIEINNISELAIKCALEDRSLMQRLAGM